MEGRHCMFTWNKDRRLVRQVWGNRSVQWAKLKSIGNSGGIIILWDKRQWANNGTHQGSYTLSCMKLLMKNSDGVLQGLWATHKSWKNGTLAWTCSNQGYLEWTTGNSVIVGDFNVSRYESERHNYIRRSRAMKSFSATILEFGIIDLPL